MPSLAGAFVPVAPEEPVSMSALGVFTRPWTQWDAETAYAAIAEAGYDGVGLMQFGQTPLLWRESSPEERQAVMDALDRRSLKPLTNMLRLPLDGDAEACAEALRAEVDLAVGVGIRDLMLLGAGRPEQYPIFLDGCRLAAPYAEERGVILGVKPHGGLTLTSEDLLRCVEYVNCPAYGIWYDPGNLIHYALQPPEWLLDEMLPHIVGVCVKDIRGGLRGNVNIEPGTGEVDMAGIFGRLHAGGMDGPYVVECLGGATQEEVLENAGRTLSRMREWLA